MRLSCESSSELHSVDLTDDEVLNDYALTPPMNRKRIAFLILIPTFFDLGENICRNISNILLTPSVSQMLRSSIVVFTAILGVIFLKLKLYRHHKISILAVVLGLLLVGISSFLSGADSSSSTKTLGQIALGIML